ncbi:hypothetical protein [Acidithiobacillus albertensis]|uniref:hypothetical protein n=1 Tax=Acidithiobacillus albertensis TaxID=119978 RepID=UPI00094B5B78|nr:hypothetical protein [Acidithiobacillus albertensis]
MAVTGAYGSASVVTVTATGATIAAVEPVTSAVVSGAEQGPPGPAGSVKAVQATAAVTISANTAIALVNGQAVPAQSGDATQAGNVIGIAQNGGLSGTLIDIQQLGEMSLSSWNWVLGNLIFVGPNGPLTQTPPTSGFSQIVGVPISATSMSIGLQAPVLIA